MKPREQYELLRCGADAWNKWRVSSPHAVVELSGADLSGMDLDGVNLNDAYLHNADFGAVRLRNAFLSNADLTHANLNGVDLSLSYLANTDFTGAYVMETRFVHTKLAGANFTHAVMDGTVFADADLSEVIGLELADHHGPSTIGIETLYKSKGKIPENFLRGCGVPDNLIRYLPSLLNAESGIQFYSCFISYSSKDEEFARRLHGRMRGANLRVWFAPEEIQGGKKLHEQIETAIRVYDKLLIVLSEASLQSEWVMTELRKARKAELQSGQRKLFPVRLVKMEIIREWECFDTDSGKDLAVELREYFIPDFSRWKEHDQFEATFARLLKDMES